jgi:hypothetical protein
MPALLVVLREIRIRKNSLGGFPLFWLMARVQTSYVRGALAGADATVAMVYFLHSAPSRRPLWLAPTL